MKRTLVRNGTLIDGNGGPLRKNACLLIQDNRIVQVGDADSIAQPGGEVQVIDAQGGYILPGFIDCHVHVVLENLTIERVLATPLSFTLLQSRRVWWPVPGCRSALPSASLPGSRVPSRSCQPRHSVATLVEATIDYIGVMPIRHMRLSSRRLAPCGPTQASVPIAMRTPA